MFLFQLFSKFCPQCNIGPFNLYLLVVGYETPEGQVGYNWGEDDWMNAWVDYDGSYKTEYTTAGVTYKYTRLRGYSTIRVDGK